MDDTVRSSGSFDSHDRVVIGRIDMVTGPTGRRKWPDELKGRLVAESYKTDLSVSEFARWNGLVPSQLFGWRRDAKDGKFTVPVDEGEELFAPLMLEAPLPREQQRVDRRNEVNPPEQIEIQAGGVVIRLPRNTSATRVAEIARALA
ncbi:MAG: transposase [Pseudomonadota bacterium]